jgi:hypothetical protein
MLSVNRLDRKSRFWIGFLLVFFVYLFPIVGLAVNGAVWYLVLALACFAISVLVVYRATIKNVKPKYPLVNPEGHPDIYSGRMPRPIYEDMKRYPWFFNKKKRARFEKKKVKKKR